MIDTIREQQTRCNNPTCGKLLTQRVSKKGHRQRQYCNDVCKQTAYRARKGQHSNSVTIVANDDSTLQAHIFDRAKMEARFMHLGEQVHYHPLTTFSIFGGSSYWQDFMNHANDETLMKAIAAAEYYLEGLIALRGDPRERRIAELEHQVKELSAKLALEDAYHYDTQERHFKSWLRKHPQPRDTAEVFKRILADTRLPQHGSRSTYEARLRLHGYSAEDILLFQSAWRDMMFMQS